MALSSADLWVGHGVASGPGVDLGPASAPALAILNAAGGGMWPSERIRDDDDADAEE